MPPFRKRGSKARLLLRSNTKPTPHILHHILSNALYHPEFLQVFDSGKVVIIIVHHVSRLTTLSDSLGECFCALLADTLEKNPKIVSLYYLLCGASDRACRGGWHTFSFIICETSSELIILKRFLVRGVCWAFGDHSSSSFSSSSYSESVSSISTAGRERGAGSGTGCCCASRLLSENTAKVRLGFGLGTGAGAWANVSSVTKTSWRTEE